MSDTEDIKNGIINSRLKNRDGKPTWLICVIKKEYSSYTSIRILNGNLGNDDSHATHPEAKFFDVWWKNPKKIFPDLPFNEIEKQAFNLIWYTLTSPCNNCVQMILGNHHLYNNLTIFTSSVFRSLKENLVDATNRIYELRGKGVSIEPISAVEYHHFTTGRIGHELPQLQYFNSEQEFIDLRLPINGNTIVNKNNNNDQNYGDTFESPIPPKYESITQRIQPKVTERVSLLENEFLYHGCQSRYHPQLPNTYPFEEQTESASAYKIVKHRDRKLKRLKRKKIFTQNN